MNSAPNAEEKRWREHVRDMGSVISGGPAIIHHCAGRTAKHNKIVIGHWWILPLTDREHMLLHAGKFDQLVEGLPSDTTRKEFEKYLFVKVLLGTTVELPAGVTEAIMDYRR